MFADSRVFSAKSLRQIISLLDSLRQLFVDALERNKGVTALQSYKQDHLTDVHLAPENYYSFDLPGVRVQIRLVGKARYTYKAGFVARYAVFYCGSSPITLTLTKDLLGIDNDSFGRYDGLYGDFHNIESAAVAFYDVVRRVLPVLEF